MNLTLEEKINVDLEYLGIKLSSKIYRNLNHERLAEEGIANNETKLGMNGASMVDTGIYTGRSPKDKYFVVEDSSKDKIWWGEINQKLDSRIFDELLEKVQDFYNTEKTKTYIFDGFGGADYKHRLPIRIVAKKAW